MTAARTRLPDRRPAVTDTVTIGSTRITVSAGIDPISAQIREVFLGGAKEGSTMDCVLADTATVVSIALQYGVPLEALARSIARIPLAPTRPEDLDGRKPAATIPASPIGAALDALLTLQTTLAEAAE